MLLSDLSKNTNLELIDALEELWIHSYDTDTKHTIRDVFKELRHRELLQIIQNGASRESSGPSPRGRRPSQPRI